MQLKAGVPALAVVAATVLAPAAARAQVVDFDTTHSLFYEAPTRTNMFVYTPSGDLQVTPFDWLDVRAGWEADVVSGASVSTKAGPIYATAHPNADVVSTASVHDFRNQGRGGFTLRPKDGTSITGGYSYSTEHDYQSNTFNVTARTDAYDHNTQFEIGYARNFDRVCDIVQRASANSPTLYDPLDTSTGCFTASATRTTHDIDIDSFQAAWSQSWTPIFVTQLIYTAEITSGFQSNPYRAVIIGEGIRAQEHEPDNRARQSVTARANVFLRPLKAALHFGARGYSDTWEIRSGMLEAEYEQHLGERLRALLHVRGYKQSGAVFWSDDYTGGNPPLGPRGQYWTGDRELSPFYSLAAGARFMYTITPAQGRILGILLELKLGLSGDIIAFHYDEYTLGGEPISNARAYLGTLSLQALF